MALVLSDYIAAIGSGSTSGDNPITWTHTFPAQPAGRLLLAVVCHGRQSSLSVLTAGWTTLFRWRGATDDSDWGVVLGKIADGTETELVVRNGSSTIVAQNQTDVLSIAAQAVLSQFGGMLDSIPPDHLGDSTVGTFTTDDIVPNSSLPNVRLDFAWSGEAPAAAPSTGHTGTQQFISYPGTARRGGCAVFATEVNASTPPVEGWLYDSPTFYVHSLLLRVTPVVGWRVGSIGFG